MSAPTPWRPWEACMTLNDHWGYHVGDDNWKRPDAVVGLLAAAAQNRGNLLLNIGPRGDGSIPERSVEIIETVGGWLRSHGECLFDTDPFTFSLLEREGHNGDYSHNGPFTLKGRNLYQIVRYWPGPELVVAGLDAKVLSATLIAVNGSPMPCAFTQTDGKVVVSGLPETAPAIPCPVIRFSCETPPSMYLAGGMRIPQVPHPPYDPCPSDIAE